MADSRSRIGRRWVFAGVGSAALALLGVAVYRSASGPAPAAENSAAAPVASATRRTSAQRPDRGRKLAPSAQVSEHAAQPSAAKPSTVELIVKEAPAGAAVLLGKEKLGEAPGPLLLPYGREALELRIVCAGYEPKTISVVPSARVEVAAPLVESRRAERRGREPPSGQALPSDFEDPF